MNQTTREWEAWLQICKHLDLAGVEINDNNGLAAAIRLWGEELVALRDEQPDTKSPALEESRTAYCRHFIFY